ncbi:hypothetical protein GGX14DRAFT_569030 [Mycena pura]|uniref:Uncharacterized protein n=1 Tax=Mycena pura TaxID=153505 RepID=A0AAD6V822_9AGAR|nr:hypothetical protein GGX14DRAFT_569030 [Mycena pura]
MRCPSSSIVVPRRAAHLPRGAALEYSLTGRIANERLPAPSLGQKTREARSTDAHIRVDTQFVKHQHQRTSTSRPTLLTSGTFMSALLPRAPLGFRRPRSAAACMPLLFYVPKRPVSGRARGSPGTRPERAQRRWRGVAGDGRGRQCRRQCSSRSLTARRRAFAAQTAGWVPGLGKARGRVMINVVVNLSLAYDSLPADQLKPITTDGGDGHTQTFYATNFANRLVARALSNPCLYKMELLGTKPVHKPPNDRAVGVREVFAAGVEEEEEDSCTAVEEAGPPVGSVKREKRVYRGWDALHRCQWASPVWTDAFALGWVFDTDESKNMSRLIIATVFPHDGVPKKTRHRGWKDYALAILLCVLLLCRRARPAAKLVRCASISANENAREAFRTDTILGVFFPLLRPREGSPALRPGMFSLRPEAAARMVGLDVLGVHEPIVAIMLPAPIAAAAGSCRMPWAALGMAGLSMLAINPHVIARMLRCSAATPFLVADTLCTSLERMRARRLRVQYRGRPDDDLAERDLVWARDDELCHTAGDECSWRANVAAICSPPVVRFDKAWRCVERPGFAVLSCVEKLG